MTNSKLLIRKYISASKKKISLQAISDLSQKICDRLIDTEIFQKANCVALYYALEDEVRTSGIIKEWYKKKTIGLPVISGENIDFHLYTGEDYLKKGVFGISEPASGEIITPENIDLYIIPGIAFDRNGNRIGRGKGYYDRYLHGIDKPIIGVCFDFQLIEMVPAEKHDIKMTMVITENVTLSLHHQ